MREVVKSKVIAALFIFMSLLVVQPVAAIDLSTECDTTGSDSTICTSADSEKELGTIFGKITNALFFILGGLAVIMIVYSGIRYTTSAGNPNGIESAKKSLTYSVIGLVVAILAYAIVNFIVQRLG